MAIRNEDKTRPSAVAGTFYEGDALILRRRMAEAEAAVRKRLAEENRTPMGREQERAGRVKGLILPHAGYIFSLETAMAGFLDIAKDACERVILLGPSHYSGFRGIVMANYDRWSTPFGELSTAKELTGRMREWNTPLLTRDDPAHTREHSLEVQLPLIQYFLGQPQVLPLLVGALNRSDVDTLAPLLASLDDPGTLWIVSSDFTHYGERFQYVPFRDNVAEQLKDQDHTAAQLAADRDAEGFIAYLSRTGATVCGVNPIVLFLAVLDRIDPERTINGAVLAESNSGDLTGDYSHAVGYETVRFSSQDVT